MCIYVEDDEGELLDYGDRRARKQHKCQACYRMIEPGETYRFWKTLYDGNFDTQKMCAHCWACINTAAKIAGCPVNWYWESVFSLVDDEGAFMADIIENHDLPRRQMAYMRLLRAQGRRRWHAPDGSLYPIPVAA